MGYWIGITGIITSALILAYPNNTSIHFGMYYWAGSVYACQATFFAWANDVLRYEEDSLRAVVIASMNMGSNAVNAWWSILFYGANFAPRFTRGMWAMIAVSIASTSLFPETFRRVRSNLNQWRSGLHYSCGCMSEPRSEGNRKVSSAPEDRKAPPPLCRMISVR